MKSKIKHLFQATNSLHVLDKILYIKAKLSNRINNKKFKIDNPDFKIPPDYFLHETYKLDYQQYKEDGMLAAQEIYEWTKQYLPKTGSVLEWGCGVARIIRHFNTANHAQFQLFGADINEEMIRWDKDNIDGVAFKTINYQPPTSYPDNSFDLAYAFSVFTHIEGNNQEDWINEIARIVKTNGIFLFTTHGTHYVDKLSETQKTQLHLEGFYTISFIQKGHKMMTTHNLSQRFAEIIENKFEIISFFEGKHFKEKAGGQDLWIVRKK